MNEMFSGSVRSCNSFCESAFFIAEYEGHYEQ